MRPLPTSLLRAMPLVMLVGGTCCGQIAFDGSLGPAGSPAGVNSIFEIPADSGQTVGTNLFHSFSDFNVHSGETASFTGPDAISNILSRVTGGMASTINGTLRSDIPNANLFLFNPSGIVIGSQAELDVNGSFHASTADFIRLADGGRFDATSPGESVLTAGAVAAFGFSSLNPQSLSVNGGMLHVNDDRELGLVGGGITLSSAEVVAPGGGVRLVSVGGPGDVPVDGSQIRAENESGTLSLGPIDVTGSRINVDGNAAGAIAIYGQHIDFETTLVSSETRGDGPGGDVDIYTSGTLTLANESQIITQASGNGTGGDITITADTVILDGNGLFAPTAILTRSVAAGAGGDINIAANALGIFGFAEISTVALASGAGGNIGLTVDGHAQLNGLQGGIFTVAFGNSVEARGGDLTITADSLAIENWAAIKSTTGGLAAGGNIDIDVAESLVMDGTGQVFEFQTFRFLSEISSITTGQNANATGGNISINAGAMTVRNLAQISTKASGLADGGSVDIDVAGALNVDGQLRVYVDALTDVFVTGIFAVTTGSDPDGRGGDIEVTAGSVDVVNFAQISSMTSGNANGGLIDLDATGSITLDGGLGVYEHVNNETFVTGVSSRVSTSAAEGKGGDIELSAGSITISNLAELSTETSGLGQGGNITVVTDGAIVIDGSNDNSAVASTTLSSSTDFRGHGGRISIAARSLDVLGFATISSTTSGTGVGGDIHLTVDERTLLSGLMGGIYSTTKSFSALGVGGDLDISTGTLVINNLAAVKSSTTVFAPGGDISVTATDSIALDGAGTVFEFQSRRLRTEITTVSEGLNADATGGSITINTDALNVTNLAAISTTTNGNADGGAIDINVTGAIALAGGLNVHLDTVTTDVFVTGISSRVSEPRGFGNGGDIDIDAGSMNLVNLAVISSENAGLGAGGEITITTDGAFVLDGSNDNSPFVLTELATRSTLSGGGGAIHVEAQALEVIGIASISTMAAGTGPGGDVHVLVDDRIRLSGIAGGIFTSTSSNLETGRGGNLDIETDTLVMENWATISSLSSLFAPGGNIDITASGAIELDGAGQIIELDNLRFLTEISSVANGQDPGAAGGYININADSLRIENLARVTSRTNAHSDGGRIDINVTRSIDLDGQFSADVDVSNNLFVTGISSVVNATTATGAGGNIIISAGSVDISDLAVITTRAGGLTPGGDVTITSTGPVSLNGGGNFLTFSGREIGTGIVSTAAGGSTAALGGDILIIAPSVEIKDFARIISESSAIGAAGSIDIEFDDALMISGSAPIDTESSFATGITSENLLIQGAASVGDIRLGGGEIEMSGLSTVRTTNNGLGSGGDITIETSELTVLDTSLIASGTLGLQIGGNVMINADTITVDGNGESGGGLFTDQFTGDLNGQIVSGSLGAGDINISADALSVLNGGTVTSTSFGFGPGGGIRIELTGDLLIDGDGLTTAIAIPLHASSTGEAQSLTIDANSISVVDGGQISATSNGANIGNIDVTADTITLDGQFSSDVTGIIANAFGGQENSAGAEIQVTSSTLNVRNGARISTRSGGLTDGGMIKITSDVIHLTADGAIFADSIADTGGNAGNILLTAKIVSIISGSQISAISQNDGRAGTITVETAQLVIDGQGNPLTGIASQPQSPNNNQRGGDVIIVAEDISITDGVISTASFNNGDSGNILVQTGNIRLIDSEITTQKSANSTGVGGRIEIEARNAIQLFSNSAIKTIAPQAEGGDIILTATYMLRLVDSLISAEAGQNGGNIYIDPIHVILDNGRLIANAIHGNGGDIAVFTEVFLTSPDSVVSASSRFGVAGNIEIFRPDIDITGGLASLPATMRSREDELFEGCEVKATGKQSSFFVHGRGGIPPEPGGAVHGSFRPGSGD